MRRQILSLLLVFSTVFIGDIKISLAQSANIFGDASPSQTIYGGLATTFGVKFWSSKPGTISGIRFYRTVKSPQGYIASLYSAGGTLLGSAALAQETGALPGWQVANFASPIPISPDTIYIAAYYCPVGYGAWAANGLSYGVTNGLLTAPASLVVGGNGVYNYGNVFPGSSNAASNYYVDVAFAPAPAAAAYLALSFNPPNPSIAPSAPLGSVVATINASWSDGSPFTGTLAFAQPFSNDQGVFAISGNELIINPAGPGVSTDADTTIDVTVVATQ